MIIDAKSHAMMTARQIPRMLLIEPTVDAAAGVLRIRIPGSTAAHEIPIEPPADAERLTDLKVWSSVAMDGLVMSPVGGARMSAATSCSSSRARASDRRARPASRTGSS